MLAAFEDTFHSGLNFAGVDGPSPFDASLVVGRAQYDDLLGVPQDGDVRVVRGDDELPLLLRLGNVSMKVRQIRFAFSDSRMCRSRSCPVVGLGQAEGAAAPQAG